MSINSFKKTVWEEALLTEFRGVSVANIITTAPTRIEGEKAIFNKISGGTIKDYTGTVEYDDVTTAPIELNFDTKKYFAITLDDVDAVQAVAPVLGQVAQEKALDLKEVQDGLVFAEAVKSASKDNIIGRSKDIKCLTSANLAYDFLVDLGTKLSKKKVPMAGRFACASAEFINYMAKDTRFADNFSVLPNGVVQGATVAGFTLIQTEDVPANTVIALHKSALGYATQLDKVEALRREGSFSDAVRGLQVSGLTTLRDNAIAILNYTLPSTTVTE
nr:MAG TPA: Major capsid protein [Caudoviricetes sp.]